MEAPILLNPISTQVVNEQAAYGPFDLKEYIQDKEESKLTFRGELKDGEPLPKGMICTEDGILTGIPSKGTAGLYEVLITAENKAGSVQAEFSLTIKPSLIASDSADYFDKLKSQVWEALDQKLPVPDMEELFDRPITPLDIYYLLERWGILKVWDAFNLDPPGEMVPLNLTGASKHYHVYDRGSCIVACPKDLFSFERTIEDGMQTARAVANEVYKRSWTVQLVGFEKLTRAAWVEIQHLGDKHGKKLEVINFTPSHDDVMIYTTQALEKRMQGKD